MAELLNKISELVTSALGVDFSQILVQMLSILILFLVIRYKVWKPITENLEARRNFIEEQVKLAEQSKLEIELEKEKNSKEIEKVKAESREIVSRAQTQANAEAVKIIEDAKQQANQEIAKAKVIIENDTQKAKEDIKKEIIEVSFEIASKLVEKEIDREQNEKFVSDMIDGVRNNAS